MVTDGRAAGAAGLQRAVDAFLRGELSDDDFVQWGHLAATAAALLWDWQSWGMIESRHVEVARARGLAPLSIALNARGLFAAWCGDFDEATGLIAEHDAVNEATGIEWYSAGGLLHAAYLGRPEGLDLMTASAAASAERGWGTASQFAAWTRAILCNGLGRYADALAAAESPRTRWRSPGTGWALVEMVEAAVRSRRPEAAQTAMEHLTRHTVDGSDWSAGIEARCRALISEGEVAERWYGEAVERLSRTALRPELARAHLLYGEWLRREGRRVDARAQLTSAHDMFMAIGAEAFAERARRELLATGAKVRKRVLGTQNELTPQEEHIARLARDGRSNSEIGGELFLSVRTVEWHLRKVFTKLEVSSREDLREALPARGQNPHVPA